MKNEINFKYPFLLGTVLFLMFLTINLLPDWNIVKPKRPPHSRSFTRCLENDQTLTARTKQTGRDASVIPTTHHSFPNCMRNAFSSVLLVVVFNYPFYDSIPLLERFYKPAFPSIMYCGPTVSEKFKVVPVEINKGYYGYECMGVAIRRYPGYKGYLYVNDDMIVNYWNLLNIDRDRIWLGKIREFPSNRSQEMFKPPTDSWHWWHPPQNALQRCGQAVQAISSSHRESERKLSLKILLANGGGKLCCFKALSDFFYVPSKFSQTFQNYSSFFFARKVFLEVAVPTIAYLLEYSGKIRYIQGVDLHWIYGDGMQVNNGFKVWLQYSTDKIKYIHPFKLHYGDADVKKLNSVLFTRWIIKLSELLTQC